MVRKLIDRMPQWLREDLFPPGSELIAACHDIGKVSPTFQEKIYRGTEGYKWNSKPELININPDIEKSWGGHAGVSQATADALEVGKYIPDILGQHHGYSPKLSNLATDAPFGGKAWQQRREELVATLKKLLKCDFPTVKSSEHARVLAGLTSVADWIGSSSLFDNPETDWQPLILFPTPVGVFLLATVFLVRKIPFRMLSPRSNVIEQAHCLMVFIDNQKTSLRFF
jgi:CRISPR-associated endonuclease/helicase Cas3